MSKLVLISGKKMCKLLEKLGFENIHQKGIHARYKHSDGRITSVPLHANEDIGRGLIREILKQIKLSREDYEELRQKV